MIFRTSNLNIRASILSLQTSILSFWTSKLEFSNFKLDFSNFDLEFLNFKLDSLNFDLEFSDFETWIFELLIFVNKQRWMGKWKEGASYFNQKSNPITYFVYNSNLCNFGGHGTEPNLEGINFFSTKNVVKSQVNRSGPIYLFKHSF